MDPVCAVIAPLKKPFSVYRPKPGSLLPYKYPEASPERSPNLDLNCKSYAPDPVLSTISIYGVETSLGLAFIIIYPDDISCAGLNTPVDTNTCPSLYGLAVDTNPDRNSASKSTKKTVSPKTCEFAAVSW